MPGLFDKVILSDGRVGTIAEVLEPGVAYEFEYSVNGDGTALDIETVYQDDVAGVVQPFEDD